MYGEISVYCLKFVWRQSGFAIFGALTSVGALFIFKGERKMAIAKITYEGYNADLQVFDDKIVIIGKGYNKGIGEKTIPMASISAVQIIPSKMLVNGYITFNVLGENAASRGGIGSSVDARKSENTVIVNKKAEDEILKQIKAFVEDAKERASANQGQTVIQQASAADELRKFKELLDMGIITQAEFDAKKKELLGF